MNTQLKKRYGLLTAICMVVGIVIGSGVFFKAGKVLENTDGNLGGCLLTVAVVGLIMLICSYVFSILARKYERVNGLVDYAEVALGPAYAYGVGWFAATVYYPTLTSCLAWISADYTCVLLGLGEHGDYHLVIAAFYLVAAYAVNALSPRLAGRLQVSTTIIKLIPLAVMAVVGTAAGLINGMTVEAFTSTVSGGTASSGGSILTAICAFAFAYEGWIIATSINAELKDAKKNLPIALVVGSLIVIFVYLAYFLGLSGALSTEQLMHPVKNVPMDAFSALFGSEVFGTLAFVFVVISCLGTVNGLMLGCCRGMYSVATRGHGLAPEVFSQVDRVTNMPGSSAVFGLLVCFFWLLQWQLGIGQVIAGGVSPLPAAIAWESDELPIITLYGAYIPIFISLMIKGKDLNPFKRFVMPAIAVLCCVFMIYCAFAAYGMDGVYYLIAFAVIMLIGFAFYKRRPFGGEQV